MAPSRRRAGRLRPLLDKLFVAFEAAPWLVQVLLYLCTAPLLEALFYLHTASWREWRSSAPHNTHERADTAAVPLPPTPQSMRRDAPGGGGGEADAASADAATPPLPTFELPTFELPNLLAADGASSATRLVTRESLLAGLGAGQLRILVLLGGYRANGPYHDLMRDICMLLRVLGPQSGANRLTGCTVITCVDPQRAQKQLYWAKMERGMQSEGHDLQVLHQADPAAYAAWEQSIERQIGFEINASPKTGLLDSAGVCHWLDYGPSGGAPEAATELDIRVWELLGERSS